MAGIAYSFNVYSPEEVQKYISVLALFNPGGAWYSQPIVNTLHLYWEIGSSNRALILSAE